MAKETKTPPEAKQPEKEPLLNKLPEAGARITPPQIPPLPVHKQGTRVSDIVIVLLILLGLALCGLSIWGIIAVVRMIVQAFQGALLLPALFV
jgi:hypothetical protein